jgi:hypothetical protein
MKDAVSNTLASLVENPSATNIIPDIFYPNLAKKLSEAILKLA